MSSWVLSQERSQKSSPNRARFPEFPRFVVPTSLSTSYAADLTLSRPSAGLLRQTSELALRLRITTRRFRFLARLVSTALTGALFLTGRRSRPLGRERCDGACSILERSQLRSPGRAVLMPKRLQSISRRP